MRNEFDDNDKLLDRLADGELPDGDYRQLLQRLEDSPDGWRRCALTFLEQQALQRDLRQILNDGSRLEFADEVLIESDFEDEEIGPFVEPNRWENWLARPWVRWTSVLAVGILAFVGGVALRPLSTLQNQAGSNIAPNNSLVPQGSLAQADHRNATERASIIIDDPTDGSPHSLQIPVQPIGMGGNNGIPKFASEHFSRRFTHAIDDTILPSRVERLVYVVQTPDGRLFLLPIDRIVQTDAYQ